MDSERWRQVRDLFERALDLDPDARGPFLDEACAGDAGLRDQVEGLIAAEAEAPDTLAIDVPTAMLREALEAAPAESQGDQWAGLRLGAWRLDREIGRGGMGAVYLAQRADGQYLQRAAVKLVRSGWDVESLGRRFRAERQILAQLEHPNIARLLDGGVSEDGKPYLVLEYVNGLDLIAYCDHARLDIRARLELFLTVCEAVEHAHRKLIVHRDLKPSNIMVDTTGQVKLLDFGIAKLLQDGVEDRSETRIFTPEYAAPEQLRGDPVTTSIDVHALGVILFELLTGAHPYPVDTPTPAAYSQAVLTGEPTLPSRAAGDTSRQGRLLARRRRSSPALLSGRLRGDLDAIVLKALRKDPVQRYLSVAALAGDVRAYLSHRPVSARRGRLRYRAGRFLRRNALASALGATVVLLLVGGLLLSLWQAGQTRRQRDMARLEAANAQAVSSFLSGVFEQANPEVTDGSEPGVRDLLDRAVERIDAQPGMQPDVRGRLLATMGHAYQGLGEHPRATELLKRALRDAEAAGDPALQVTVHRRLGDSSLYAGKYERALDHARAQLRILEAAGITDPELLTTARLKVGTSLNHLGRHEDAAQVLLPLFDEVRSQHGPASAQMAEMLPALAAAMARLGRAAEVVPLTRVAYEAVQASPELPLLTSSLLLNAHGLALGRAGLSEEAEPIEREYLAQVTRLYGEDDTRTSVAMNNVAQSLSRLGRVEEAVAMMEQVVAIRRRNLAPDHERLAAALVNQGVILRKAGKPDDALAALEEAFTIFEGKGQGTSRPAVQALMVKAQIHEDQGRWPEALDLIGRVRPFVDAEPSYYPGAEAATPLLVQARLQYRLQQLPPDCDPLPRTVALADLPAHQAQEARILAAVCAQQHGRDGEAETLLAGLTEAPLAPGVSALARELLPALSPR
ncbi:serine/threonine-protein kinase [Pseudofulvimonas gallinarii]|uniref:Serine/threonine-protein kinase n=1 Tax=Pseudofulvimonas gallinarii TaxID=634155 RepID=A0A4S3KT72_9GAMM|nr:serine/threonine-protein kinase [Pseudofulvimonas gallinarii]TCS99573.1 serine/threonine-protein kinase [Pseudofulvimonas gallinarii]THD12357.1 hypothetical protein B1808_13330 [Pseudofulvimonas gallinarii]